MEIYSMQAGASSLSREPISAHTQRIIVLRAVKKNPGLTSFELSRKCDLDRYQIARRLTEVKEIKRGKKRVCTVCKQACWTWRMQ